LVNTKSGFGHEVSTLGLWAQKSADLPYFRSGLVQPLISYGEVCANDAYFNGY